MTAIEKLEEDVFYTVAYTDQHGARHEAEARAMGALKVGDKLEVYYRLDQPDDTSAIADVRLGPPGSLVQPDDSAMIGMMIFVGIAGAGVIALLVYKARRS